MGWSEVGKGGRRGEDGEEGRRGTRNYFDLFNRTRLTQTLRKINIRILNSIFVNGFIAGSMVILTLNML